MHNWLGQDSITINLLEWSNLITELVEEQTIWSEGRHFHKLKMNIYEIPCPGNGLKSRRAYDLRVFYQKLFIFIKKIRFVGQIFSCIGCEPAMWQMWSGRKNYVGGQGTSLPPQIIHHYDSTQEEVYTKTKTRHYKTVVILKLKYIWEKKNKFHVCWTQV